MALGSPKPKKILEPQNTEELLRAWLIHSHKGRQRQDRAARRLDRWRILLGASAAILSAAVGTSVFAALLKEETSLGIKLAIAGVSVLAAVLTGLGTFLDLGERANTHKASGVRYKSMIRELEVKLTGGTEKPKIEDSEIENIRKRLDELEANSPIMPERIYLIIDKEWNDRGLEIINKAVDFYKPKTK